MSTEVDRAAARKQPPRLVTKFGPVAMLLAGRRWFPPGRSSGIAADAAAKSMRSRLRCS